MEIPIVLPYVILHIYHPIRFNLQGSIKSFDLNVEIDSPKTSFWSDRSDYDVIYKTKIQQQPTHNQPEFEEF